MEQHPQLSPSTSPERDVDALRWHRVSFYDNEPALVDLLGGVARNALIPDHAALVIATAPHRVGLRQRANSIGLDLEMAAANGQYVELDAEELLSRILVDGRPSRTRFNVVIPGLLRTLVDEHPHVHIFAEMMALLWQNGHAEATYRLEELWNELGRTRTFSLVCGYPRSAFSLPEHRSGFERICAAHSPELAA